MFTTKNKSNVVLFDSNLFKNNQFKVLAIKIRHQIYNP